jgi:pimeloyl-ACP methyl ester carboxylesterase
VAVGDEVVLIGRQGDAEITAASWAERSGTIAYEIVCGISPRVPRRYQEDHHMTSRKRHRPRRCHARHRSADGRPLPIDAPCRCGRPGDARCQPSVVVPSPTISSTCPRTWCTIEIGTSDGGTVHAIEKGQGRPLVLLHGITLRSDVWAPQFHQLADRYRVIAVDLRGHGESTAGEDGFGISRLADDLATVLEGLDLRRCRRGRSLDGWHDRHAVLRRAPRGAGRAESTGWCSWRRGRTRCCRRTSIGERGPWWRRAKAMIDGGGALPARATVTDIRAARLAFGDKPSKKAVEIVAEMGQSMVPESLLPSLAGLIEHDARVALRATKTPALVVVGTRDLLTPVPAGRHLAHLLPDAEFVVLPKAGHQLMQERPDELAELIDAFVARIDGVADTVAEAVADQDGTVVSADQVEQGCRRRPLRSWG